MVLILVVVAQRFNVCLYARWLSVRFPCMEIMKIKSNLFSFPYSSTQNTTLIVYQHAISRKLSGKEVKVLS